EVLAFAVENAHAKDEIAYRAGMRTARTGQTSGNATAEGGARWRSTVHTEMRRFEGEHLIGFGHCCIDLGQRCSGASGDHELSRIVVDDAGVCAGLEHVTGQRLTVEILAAAATDSERAFRRGRRPNALLPAGDDGVAHAM